MPNKRLNICNKCFEIYLKRGERNIYNVLTFYIAQKIDKRWVKFRMIIMMNLCGLHVT